MEFITLPLRNPELRMIKKKRVAIIPNGLEKCPLIFKPRTQFL